MPPKILILTAAYGEGHNAAANALAAAFNETAPGSAQVVDVFALCNPRLNRVVRRAYLAAINGTPHLWKYVYRVMDMPGFTKWGMSLLRDQGRLLGEIIAREQPSAVCSSFPAYAAMLQKLAAQGLLKVPHFNIVTDSISINSVWWRPGCDGWFVPNEDTAAVMAAAGVDPARLWVSGFPVTPYFRRNEGVVTRPDLASGGVPRVLYIVNSGTRHAEETARLLLAEGDWEITCTVGRDDALRRKLLAAAEGRGRRADILGWTDRIPHLLMSHHVVVSKAGGATTQEAIAARCPMVVNQVVPGQEEGNCELLLRHGAGTLATSPGAVMAALRAAFSEQGRTWAGWRAALEPMARPDAARAVAARVAERIGADAAKPDEGLLAATP
jgi:processive 1,2-diacylglycerol beta-glucosyltransferase